MEEKNVSGKLHCQVVTPEKRTVDVDANFVLLTAVDGQIGILPDHAPLLCELTPGMVKIVVGDRPDYYFVAGGFAEVLDNNLTILTSEAVHASDIHADEIQKRLEELRSATPQTEADRITISREIKIAEAKLEIHRINSENGLR